MDQQIRDEYFFTLNRELQELVDPQTGMLSLMHARIVPCPLCGQPESSQRELFRKEGYRFVRCQNCHMIFSNPQVLTGEIQENYEASSSSDLWVRLQLSEQERGWKGPYYFQALDILERHVDKLGEISLLDVGCSVGHFLQLATERFPHWKFDGLEFNKLALNHCRKINLNVFDLPLGQLPESSCYQVITLFGVLEHICRPKDFLAEVSSRLTDSGLVMAIVPNVYSLYHMFLQGHSRSFDGRNHLLYFSSDTLKQLFEQCGFELLHSDTVLTGLPSILRQAQWLDPNSHTSTLEFLPTSLSSQLDPPSLEEWILKNNLGLRLRVLAKKRGH